MLARSAFWYRHAGLVGVVTPPYLLPIVLQGQLPLEVTGVGDILELAEQVTARKDVHRAYM